MTRTACRKTHTGPGRTDRHILSRLARFADRFSAKRPGPRVLRRIARFNLAWRAAADRAERPHRPRIAAIAGA